MNDRVYSFQLSQALAKRRRVHGKTAHHRSHISQLTIRFTGGASAGWLGDEDHTFRNRSESEYTHNL